MNLAKNTKNKSTCEIKWGKKIPQAPGIWKETYPESEYEVINRDNFLEFVAPAPSKS